MIRHDPSSPATFLLLCVLTACGGEVGSEVDAGRPVVADSAGVRVVTYDGLPTPTREITVSEAPLMEHGHRDGDVPFDRILHGALDAEGHAVVYDMGSGDLLRINGDGQLDTVLARRGRGPGEVLQARSLHVLDDGAVFVEDMSNARIMVFRDDEVVRSVSTIVHPGVSRGLMTRGFDAEGAPLMVTASYNPRFEEPWLHGSMVRLDLQTVTPDTVATFEMARRRLDTEPQSPWGAFGSATVAGSSFVHARSDIPELTWRRADGTIHQILRWSPEWRYPTEADWEEFADAFLEDMRRVNPQMSRDEALRFAREQLERLELRTDEPYPLFSDLRSDDEGRVWMSVFDHRRGLGQGSYRLIAPDGTWLGRVELPPAFRILDVRDGRILGVSIDELGVERVTVYGLSVSEPMES